MHELPCAAAERHDDVGDNVGDNNVEGPMDLLGHVAALDDVLRSGEAVAAAVLGRRLHGELVNVDALSAGGAEKEGGNGEDAAAAAQVQDGLAAVDALLQGLEAETGRLVGAGAEGETGLQVQDAAAVGLGRGGVLPGGLDEEAAADLHGFEVFLPVVLPVLATAGDGGEGAGDSAGRVSLIKERHSLGRVLAWFNVDVDNALRAILLQQVLIDEVNVGNFLDLVLEVTVVLYVDSVGDRHLGNGAGVVDAVGGDGNADFGPGRCIISGVVSGGAGHHFRVFHSMSLLQEIGLRGHVFAAWVVEAAVVQGPDAVAEFTGADGLDRGLHLEDRGVQLVELGQDDGLQELRRLGCAEFRLAVVGDDHMLHEHEFVLRGANVLAHGADHGGAPDEMADQVALHRVLGGYAERRGLNFHELADVVQGGAGQEQVLVNGGVDLGRGLGHANDGERVVQEAAAHGVVQADGGRVGQQ